MKNLLHTPEGVRDILGSEYSIKKDLIDKMIKEIGLFGYDMIDTPMFEFLDCFSADIGSTPVNEMYKLQDREGNLLALRPDFTPSIARVLAKYFSEDFSVIKLGYTGNVFRNFPSYSGKLNERTQLGAEYIGDSSIDADAEIIALSVNCLLLTGINDFKVSVGHTDIILGMIEQIGLDDKQKDIAISFIKNKNYFGLEEYLEKWKVDETLKDLFIDCMNPYRLKGGLDELLDRLKKIKKVKNAVVYLKNLLSILKAYEIDEYVTLDLSIVNEYKYYTGIIFYGYTYGSGNEILAGGRYDTMLARFGKDAYAVGFAIYIDDLLAAIVREDKIEKENEKINVVLYDRSDLNLAIKKANDLRQNNNTTLLCGYDSADELKELKKNYKKEIIVEIKGKK